MCVCVLLFNQAKRARPLSLCVCVLLFWRWSVASEKETSKSLKGRKEGGGLSEGGFRM